MSCCHKHQSTVFSAEDPKEFYFFGWEGYAARADGGFVTDTRDNPWSLLDYVTSTLGYEYLAVYCKISLRAKQRPFLGLCANPLDAMTTPLRSHFKVKPSGPHLWRLMSHPNALQKSQLYTTGFTSDDDDRHGHKKKKSCPHGRNRTWVPLVTKPSPLQLHHFDPVEAVWVLYLQTPTDQVA